MFRFFRLLISFFVSFELFFGGVFAGGALIAPVPQPKTAACGGYVNAFVGTGGLPWTCGMLSPAACTPFGAVRVGPDTCGLGGLNKIITNTSG